MRFVFAVSVLGFYLLFCCITRGMFRTLLTSMMELFYNNCRPEVFSKKGVLKNFTKFTGKHLRQSLFFNKVPSLRLQLLIYAFILPKSHNSKSISQDVHLQNLKFQFRVTYKRVYTALKVALLRIIITIVVFLNSNKITAMFVFSSH